MFGSPMHSEHTIRDELRFGDVTALHQGDVLMSYKNSSADRLLEI
eukprot:COSAG03_NODE_1648_length_3719_cov_8.306630_2_plen_45_part_00